MEVGQFGNLILADVIASSVGQQGDGLSCWTHLGENRGKVVRGTKADFEIHFILLFELVQKQKSIWVFLPTLAHLVGKDVKAVFQVLGVLLQLLDLVGYAALCWVRQGVSRGGQD